MRGDPSEVSHGGGPLVPGAHLVPPALFRFGWSRVVQARGLFGRAVPEKRGPPTLRPRFAPLRRWRARRGGRGGWWGVAPPRGVGGRGRRRYSVAAPRR